MFRKMVSFVLKTAAVVNSAIPPLSHHLPISLLPSPFNLPLAFPKDKPYEYVMVDSPRLASVSANGRDFAEYIASGEGMLRLGTSYTRYIPAPRDGLLLRPSR